MQSDLRNRLVQIFFVFNAVFLRKRPTIIDLFEGLWCGGTFTPLAPVLDPEQKNWPFPPSSTTCSWRSVRY